ncbi:unnamed protein product [Spodoptera littoralis]|uniref:Uncharacterized protein n=1 Tax=Spodoptera littoralis TaxID=7109 RepID=A0A9P0IFH1_SPOLI|nr:unnamed protein product [Spodoptera littoralis]CAH1645240.1 unnamed protein product [Spodoptera littoralis]
MHRRARLLLLATAAAVSAALSTAHNLRDTLPTNCGSASFGTPTGTAQRLIETQLKPGVADWNIVVPMPPACEQAEVTGVDMTVCDADAAPEVTMSDALTARVHRTGQLADFAAVNVTVHCIPPVPSTSPAPTITPAAPAPTTPPAPPSTTDARSTYEMFSDELISNEEISNETPPNYLMDYDLTSNELMPPTTTTTTTTSTTAVPPSPEVTTPQLETTSTTELITTTRKRKIRPKVKKPRTLKVTIKIAPMNHDVKENDGILKSVGAESKSSSHKDKPDQELSFQSSEYPSYMEPRFAIDRPPHHKRRHRHGPHSQHHGAPRALHWLAPRPLYGAPMPPYSVLGSTRLFGPRLLYWMRHKPTMFLSHY